MRNSRSLFILNAWGCKSSEGDQGNQELAALINLPGWLLQPSHALRGLQVSDGLCNCRIEKKRVYVLGDRNKRWGLVTEKVTFGQLKSPLDKLLGVGWER